jgi:hypothetical protein
MLVGLGAGVALQSFIFALEMTPKAATPQHTPVTPVVRFLKGDRLPLPSATGAPIIPGSGPVVRKNPVCLEANTAPRSPFAAEVPGRCMA